MDFNYSWRIVVSCFCFVQVKSNNPSLLHFAEERARREVELTTIKKQKQQLEGALRQLQEKHAMAQQLHEEQLDELRDEAERWKRNRYGGRNSVLRRSIEDPWEELWG